MRFTPIQIRKTLNWFIPHLVHESFYYVAADGPCWSGKVYFPPKNYILPGDVFFAFFFSLSVRMDYFHFMAFWKGEAML